MGNVNELKDFTRGQLDSALMKIGQDVGMKTEEAIKAFLRGELVITRAVGVWKTWMTIKLGTGLRTIDDFYKALTSGHFISEQMNEIFGNPAFTISEIEQDVELINVSVKELGFNQGACYEDICKRAFELGLGCCPSEVGLQLRLQWKDQSRNTFVMVAMKDIVDLDGFSYLFCVSCRSDGKQFIIGRIGDAGIIWQSYVRFVFIRRKVA